MQIDAKKGEISLKFEELDSLQKSGFISSDFIKTIENLMRKRSSSPSDLKVVKTDAGPFPQENPTKEMYKAAVKETDKVIASNGDYELLYFTDNIKEGCNKWGTTDLFNYLELDPEQALSELRAAVYPTVVSYWEANIQDKQGKSWRVPYLAFIDRTDPNGIDYPNKVEEKDFVHIYYLNCNGKIACSYGEIREIYKKTEIEGTDWEQFSCARKKEIKRMYGMPFISSNFVNIKTGEELYVISEQHPFEDKIEKMKNRLKGIEWYHVKDGTRRISDDISEIEKQSVVEKGRFCIQEMHRCLLDTEGLQKTPDGKLAKIREYDY